MAEARVSRTWDEFWGDLLHRRFHLDHAARWTAREERARLIRETAGLQPGERVLDLGCGDGLLDICLARLGLQVTAVDRVGSVLAAARAEPGGDTVTFVAADLREITYPPATFAAVLLFEVLGLMSASDERDLCGRIADWLTPGGCLLIDVTDAPTERSGGWRHELEGGILEVTWQYDPDTRVQHMEPLFRAADGVVIELRDAYDRDAPVATGVTRHLHTDAEVRELLAPWFALAWLNVDWRAGKRLLCARPVAGRAPTGTAG